MSLLQVQVEYLTAYFTETCGATEGPMLGLLHHLVLLFVLDLGCY